MAICGDLVVVDVCGEFGGTIFGTYHWPWPLRLSDSNIQEAKVEPYEPSDMSLDCVVATLLPITMQTVALSNTNGSSDK